MIENKRIIIATESYIINQGFHLIFNKLRHAQVIDKVESMSDLLTLLEKENADIILLSKTLITPENDLSTLLKTLSPEQPILIAYTKNGDKDIDHENIFSLKINHIDDKEDILNKLNQLMESLYGDTNEDDNDELSDREKDILKEVALGLTNNEIADKLFISVHTVITHRKKITKKLGIKSVSGLTVYAIINGLIEMEDVGSQY